MMKFKNLSEKYEQRIVTDIKSLLHAHRDCLRNRDHKLHLQYQQEELIEEKNTYARLKKKFES